jgi:glycosyltransferase involved in cell wall biosynthesis
MTNRLANINNHKKQSYFTADAILNYLEMKNTKVLHLIPARSRASMPIFIQRQLSALSGTVTNYEAYFSGSHASARSILRTIFELRATITRDNISIVHAHWGGVLALVACIASLGLCKVVITLRGSDVNPTPSDPALISYTRRLFTYLAVPFADYVIAVSEGLAKRIRVNRLAVIPDGIDLGVFHYIKKKEAETALALPSGELRVFFYAGANPKVKGYDLARAAVHRASKIDPRIKLVVVTTGKSPREINLLLNASDCLLMCSDFEGSPNIVREAITVGLPVISVDVGDVRYWVEQANAGKIVERDVGIIADAISNELSRIRRPADPALLARFSSVQVAVRIMDIYSVVLNPVSGRVA